MSNRHSLDHLERLVAHRELQLIRARGGRYAVERARKLDAALRMLARARERVGSALACPCGQTFIAVDADDRLCPACRRVKVVLSVRIVEFTGGYYSPGLMFIQPVPGLTDNTERVVTFVASELVGEGRLYSKGRFLLDGIIVRGFRPTETMSQTLADMGDPIDWHATHPDAPRKLVKTGAWAVDTEEAWTD